MEKLPIIFRKFKDTQEVIAFFPTLSSTLNIWDCESYMHVGQHGAASTALIAELDKCTVEEYTPLLKELTSIYTTDTYGDEPCELVVKRINHSSYFEKRRQAVLKELYRKA